MAVAATMLSQPDGRGMVQRVVISGASSGIGAALAEAMAAPDVHLLLLSRRSDALQQVGQCCVRRGAVAEIVSLDLRDHAAVQQAVSRFAQQGGVQLLVANAGVVELEAIPSDSGPCWERLRRQIADNIACTISLLSAGLSLPSDQRSDLHCVVISSLNAFLALGEAPGYCAAKAAQRSLVDSLEDFYACRPVKGARVRFTTVFPGFVNTEMATHYSGPRPFQLTAVQAAERILRGVRAGRRRVVFPRRLAALQWLGQRLPPSLTRRLIASSRAFKELSP